MKTLDEDALSEKEPLSEVGILVRMGPYKRTCLWWDMHQTLIIEGGDGSDDVSEYVDDGDVEYLDDGGVDASGGVDDCDSDSVRSFASEDCMIGGKHVTDVT